MKLKLTLYQQVMVMLAIPALIQIGFFVQLSNLVGQVENLSDLNYRAKHVIGQVNWISALLCASTLGCAGYALTKTSDYEEVLNNCRMSAEKELGQMLVLYRNEPAQTEQVRNITRYADQLFAELQASKTKRDADEKDASVAVLVSGKVKVLFDDLFLARRELLASDRAGIKIDPQALPNAARLTQQLVQVGIGLDAAALFFLLFFFTRSVSNRLRVLSNNAVRLAAGQPLLPQMKGDDEISQVDQTFHRMAKALAESSRRERAIVENVADVICRIDSEGRFTEVSQASKNSWGFDPAELVGLRYIELVAPDSKEHTSEILQKAQKSEENFSFENQLLHKNKSNVEVLWSGRWSQEERSTFLVAHDITERKKMENLKQQFVGMVSHDLRTPLSGVQGFLELLAGGMYPELPEDAMQRARLAHKSVDRLINLVNELLDLEKMESGAITLHLMQSDLAAIIEDSRHAVETLAAEHEVTLDCKPVAVCSLMADADRMVQVFVNLLSNAIKFSPAGATVTVEARIGEKAVDVFVRDTGRGIPEADKDKIFDRFYQVQSADGRRGVGTGLGLPICKAIVEQHKGSITVESVPGEGSTFRVSLPL
jgi:PAS domain S-box-containing protein